MIGKRLFIKGIHKSKVQCEVIIAGVVPKGQKMVIYLHVYLEPEVANT